MKKRQFQNLSPTPQFAEGITVFHAMKTMFQRPEDHHPSFTLPSVKTDLKSFYSKEPSIIWFGHSSYLIHADGINILIDPVLNGNASPVSFLLKAFKGSDVYKADDMPQIDYLIFTHNHYDHLDYKALKALANKVKRFILPLEVSDSLKGISIRPELITELNWGDSLDLEPGLSVTCTPARHFSGRGLRRNYSLWCSYVLKINGYRIFVGGDSGYDTHFKEIGDKYGPFDIAVLECGQYNTLWPYIHSFPEEVVKEGEELKAGVVMPVHWGKFALSNHNWQEPVERFVAEAEKRHVRYATPMIGEPFALNGEYPKKKWWRI